MWPFRTITPEQRDRAAQAARVAGHRISWDDLVAQCGNEAPTLALRLGLVVARADYTAQELYYTDFNLIA